MEQLQELVSQSLLFNVTTRNFFFKSEKESKVFQDNPFLKDRYFLTKSLNWPFVESKRFDVT